MTTFTIPDKSAVTSVTTTDAVPIWQNGAQHTAAPGLFLTMFGGAVSVGTRAAVTTTTIPASVNAIRTTGYATAGDGGGALYVRVGSQPSHAAKVQSADGAWWSYLPEGPVNLLVFGADNTGVTSATTAVANALAYMTSGGYLHIPAGTYAYYHGDGTPSTDNILSDNIEIYGDGLATKIVGYKGDGTTPNDSGNTYYRVFQATSRANIRLRDIAFSGYTVPLTLYSCTNVSVNGIRDDGKIADAGGYLRDRTLHFHKCSDVKVDGNYIDNSNFGIYLSGDGTTQTNRVIVSNNIIRQSATAGTFTSLFPTGVYVYYANDVSITGNIFSNIYSSVDTGNTGTGIGYAIYEGDGSCSQLSVVGNSFEYTAKASKYCIGVSISEAQEANISANTFNVGASAHVAECILIHPLASLVDVTVNGNFVKSLNTTDGYGLYATGGTVVNLSITGNYFNGLADQIRVDSVPNGVINIANNTMVGAGANGMLLAGASSSSIKNVLITGNRISGCQNNGIQFNAYIVSPVIVNNSILDGNLSNTAGESGSAILFSSYSFGSTIIGNTIGNTVPGAGKFTYGITNVSNASDRIFKDTISGNTFFGLTNQQFRHFFTASPTNGIFDINKGDYISNSYISAGGTPGWYCIYSSTQTLTGNASSASTTITVPSTSDISVGDVVLLCKDANPYPVGYKDSTRWWADIVASKTDGTHFVITNGIPAGNGTFSSGSAVCVAATLKPAAVISA